MIVPENYDFNDPKIRELVDQNHCPTEEYISTANYREVALVCGKDKQPWPCPIIVERRKHQDPA